MSQPASGAVTAQVAPLRKLLSVLFAALLLGYVVYSLDLQAFVAALGRINYFGFFAFIAVFLLLLLAADSVATSQVYGAAVGPIRFRDVFVLRGASYLPSLLNYHVGQAWLTWFVSRVYRAPVGQVVGATLIVYATVFATLFLLTATALVVGPGDVPWLLPILATIAALGLTYLLLLGLKPAFLSRFSALRVLVEVGVWGHLRSVAWRMPHTVVLFLGMWLPYYFFEVNIPLERALVFVPVLMLVGALPLTPQGVGTRDVLAINLLLPFAPGANAEEGTAAIAAASIAWACAITFVQAILSPLLMRRAQILLRQGNLMSERAPAGAS